MQYQLRHGIFGTVLRLQQEWEDSFLKVVDDNNVKEVELNHSWGWKHHGNLAFLAGLKDKRLLALRLLDSMIVDLVPIHQLSGLQDLSVGTDKHTEIDLVHFPDLERIVLELNSRARSFSAGKSLRVLHVFNSGGKDASEFAGLESLEFLDIRTGPMRTIRGLSTSRKLKYVHLSHLTKLETLVGLDAAPSLEELTIDTCKKIKTLAPLSRLTNLRLIEMNNCGSIESLEPLANLKKIESIRIAQTTDIVDGDIKLLKKLPILKKVYFRERDHYNLRNDDFASELAEPEIRKTDSDSLLGRNIGGELR